MTGLSPFDRIGRQSGGEASSYWYKPAALFPLRPRLLELGRWGGLVIASLLLIIGMVAGISGQIEALVFTKTANLQVFTATLPEVIAQTLAFGYWLMWWERRRERRAAVPVTK